MYPDYWHCSLSPPCAAGLWQILIIIFFGGGQVNFLVAQDETTLNFISTNAFLCHCRHDRTAYPYPLLHHTTTTRDRNSPGSHYIFPHRFGTHLFYARANIPTRKTTIQPWSQANVLSTHYAKINKQKNKNLHLNPNPNINVSVSYAHFSSSRLKYICRRAGVHTHPL